MNQPYVKKTYKILHARFQDIPTYTFTMKVKDLLSIYYVAVRGIDEEEGAVQRVLSKARISSIKDYILQGNTFFNSFILNWTDKSYVPRIDDDQMEIDLVHASAQVIDGQHRLEGLKAAFANHDDIGERDLVVTLCIGLTTQQAAEIFLNINTEQKPVPKSLMFDLFGEVVSDENHCINRATDIAKALNEDPSSPLYKLIKFPGAPRGVGHIELSTFVSAFKESFKKDGRFYSYRLQNLDAQKTVISNYFLAIKNSYVSKKIWDISSKNPFLKAAGFNGAVDFLLETLIPKCAEKKSFQVSVISAIINFDENNLLLLDDIKGLDGKTSRKRVKEALEKNLIQSLMDDEREYEF